MRMAMPSRARLAKLFRRTPPKAKPAGPQTSAEVRKLQQEVAKLKSTLGRYIERQRIIDTQLSLLIQAAQGSAETSLDLDGATPQERYWAGHNGVRYVLHHLPKSWEARLDIWREILARTGEISSVIELGCNIGDNLRALDHLKPNLKVTGIELNQFAAEQAKSVLPNAEIIVDSLLRANVEGKFDLAFTRGVLIHINPNELHRAYDQLATMSKKFVLIYENYSEKPMELTEYAKDKSITGTEHGAFYQFWRDFAADFKSAHPEWDVIAEGPSGVSKEHGKIVWTLFKRS